MLLITDHRSLLLTDPSPCLRDLVLTELVNLKENDEEVQELANMRSSDQLVKVLFELQKSTMISGGLENIMNSLPAHSALVFHDLELWWERSESGWDGRSREPPRTSSTSPRVTFTRSTGRSSSTTRLRWRKPAGVASRVDGNPHARETTP